MHTIVRFTSNIIEPDLMNVVEDESATPLPPKPFSCPTAFDLEKRVEIDNGVFVTCDELKPFYEIPVLGV